MVRRSQHKHGATKFVMPGIPQSKREGWIKTKEMHLLWNEVKTALRYNDRNGLVKICKAGGRQEAAALTLLLHPGNLGGSGGSSGGRGRAFVGAGSDEGRVQAVQSSPASSSGTREVGKYPLLLGQTNGCFKRFGETLPHSQSAKPSPGSLTPGPSYEAAGSHCSQPPGSGSKGSATEEEDDSSDEEALQRLLQAASSQSPELDSGADGTSPAQQEEEEEEDAVEEDRQRLMQILHRVSPPDSQPEIPLPGQPDEAEESDYAEDLAELKRFLHPGNPPPANSPPLQLEEVEESDYAEDLAELKRFLHPDNPPPANSPPLQLDEAEESDYAEDLAELKRFLHPGNPPPTNSPPLQLDEAEESDYAEDLAELKRFLHPGNPPPANSPPLQLDEAEESDYAEDLAELKRFLHPGNPPPANSSPLQLDEAEEYDEEADLAELKRGIYLGEGTFGTVRLLEKPSGKVVCKQAKEGWQDLLRVEALLLGKCQHPHVVRLLSPPSEGHRLLLEWCQTGNLLNYLMRGRKGYYCWFHQLAAALSFIHKREVVHLDLTPMNMLLRSPKDIAISDFGLARNLRANEVCYKVGGTKGYISPEVYTTGGATHKSDVWALGVIMEDIVVQVKASPSPPGSEATLARMLDDDPAERPTAKDVEEMLWGCLYSSGS